MKEKTTQGFPVNRQLMIKELLEHDRLYEYYPENYNLMTQEALKEIYSELHCQ